MSDKHKFRREEGKLEINRIVPKTDKIISGFEYENGTVKIKHENFDYTIYNVDEIRLQIKQLDKKFVEISFEIVNDGNECNGIKSTKLPMKFYGSLSEHIEIKHNSKDSSIPTTVICEDGEEDE